MARRRKHRKHANPARHRRSHRRRSRRASYAPNPLKMGGAGVLNAVLWGGAGYLGSKLLGNFAGKYTPASLPAKDILDSALGGLVVSMAGNYVAKSSEAKAALRVGAMIPVVEAAVNMTSLGAMLGTQKIVMVAPPPAKPAGVAAALSAALSADLRDDMEGDY